MEPVVKMNKRMPVATMLDPKIVMPAISAAFTKLDPRLMIKNPVLTENSTATPASLVVVEHWTEELKQHAPTR